MCTLSFVERLYNASRLGNDIPKLVSRMSWFQQLVSIELHFYLKTNTKSAISLLEVRPIFREYDGDLIFKFAFHCAFFPIGLRDAE